jgi:hypothetical protein
VTEWRHNVSPAVRLTRAVPALPAPRPLQALPPRRSAPNGLPFRYYDAGCRHYVESAPLNLLQDQNATCPHCWESITLTLDLSVPEQSYVEDCPVCCKPMLVSYTASDGEVAQFSVESAE